MPSTTSNQIGTRARILDAAAGLFRCHGFAATGLKAILSASNAPYGSLYHFFPGGKEELGVAVLRSGGVMYRELVESIFTPQADVAEATTAFFDGAAELVEATGFADACPIATMALEVADTNEPMRQAAAAAFESWLTVLTDRFEHAGVPAPRSRELAIELFCAIEGAFLLSRTSRSSEPIRIAGRAATASVRAALRR
jgi:TetR/AcrR family transcriptional regulator, lmrAB and yxaGH operons repressor